MPTYLKYALVIIGLILFIGLIWKLTKYAIMIAIIIAIVYFLYKFLFKKGS